MELLLRKRKVSACLIPASLTDKEPSSGAPFADKEAGAGIVRAGNVGAGFRLANELAADVADKLLRGRNQRLRISLLRE